jgi:undecaprenyl-diphosphatase
VSAGQDESVINAHRYFERCNAAEYAICRRLNRVTAWVWPRRSFQAASWLGNGTAWCLMVVAILLMHGAAAVRPVLAMAITCASGVLIYKWLKSRLVRERPFIRHDSIRLAMRPLDRYSFPSGHTMHAVSFAWQAVVHFPELGWLVVPLAAQIALSRVVLGLHYPTDVVAGAALGSGLALTGLALAP